MKIVQKYLRFVQNKFLINLNLTIFFDLDGTLINAKNRVFQLFKDLTSQDTISFEDYWLYKRSKESNTAILKNRLNFSNAQISEFKLAWMKQIEDEKYLKNDTLFDDTVISLEKLNSRADLYLVTARQFPDRVQRQLELLEIITFFKKILVTEQKRTKADLIRPFIINKNLSLIIGDTGEDTIAGRELKITTANVLTGFRNKEVLQSYYPDYIFNDLTAFCKEFL